MPQPSQPRHPPSLRSAHPVYARAGAVPSFFVFSLGGGRWQVSTLQAPSRYATSAVRPHNDDDGANSPVISSHVTRPRIVRPVVVDAAHVRPANAPSGEEPPQPLRIVFIAPSQTGDIPPTLRSIILHTPPSPNGRLPGLWDSSGKCRC